MPKNSSQPHLFFILFSLLYAVFFAIPANAQTDTSLDLKNKRKIQIEKADNLIGVKNDDEGYLNKFIGNVQVRSDDIVMTCDSAYLNNVENKLRAYGNVDIYKGGSSSAKANYVEYTGYTAQAIMKDNVQIIDNGSQLITDDLSYNLITKIGVYTNGGQLVSDGTTVSSIYGKYNGITKLSYFKDEVIITSEDADIESDELTYNTDTKDVVFLAYSIIYGKDATIETTKGQYNQTTGIAIFSKRTRVENDEQILTADNIKYNQKSGSGSARGKVEIVNKNDNTILYTDAANYDKQTGYGTALGNIRYIDTLEKVELNAGKVEYNEFNDFLLATENPILTTITENDTLLIASDTMLALQKKDLNLLQNRITINHNSTFELLHVKKQKIYSEDNKVIIANKFVQVYGDSLQAVSDSLIYFQTDSTLQLYKKPVLWNANQQAMGDTIYLYMENNKIRQAALRQNSFIASNTGYPNMFNQVKGITVDAFFKENQMEYAIVNGNAESIYYAVDDDDMYVGLNKSAAARIKMQFENKQIKRIAYYKKPKGVFHPMEKIPDTDRFLDGFSWKDAIRPKSREQLRNRDK